MAPKNGSDGTAELSKNKRCFVITAIGADGSPERHHADWVWGGAIEPVFRAQGYEVFRSDQIADPSMINDKIFEHIIDDEICVADLSFLNPNVFYELGVRHALQKPSIHIANQGTQLPFDTAQHRVIFFDRGIWDSFERLKQQLLLNLSSIESSTFKVSNPLTHARGRLDITTTGDSKDQLLDDLLQRVSYLERNLAKLQDPPHQDVFSGSGSIINSLKRLRKMEIDAGTFEDFLGDSISTPLSQPSYAKNKLGKNSSNK